MTGYGPFSSEINGMAASFMYFGFMSFEDHVVLLIC